MEERRRFPPSYVVPQPGRWTFNGFLHLLADHPTPPLLAESFLSWEVPLLPVSVCFSLRENSVEKLTFYSCCSCSRTISSVCTQPQIHVCPVREGASLSCLFCSVPFLPCHMLPVERGDTLLQDSTGRELQLCFLTDVLQVFK